MGSMNKVILIGNLGKDPEVRYTGAGTAVANFSMATSEVWTDKAGKKMERTEWHRLVAWGKTAELVGEYLSKGSQVSVEGKLQTREWTDKENKKQYTTEIVVREVIFLGKKGDTAQRRPEPPKGDHGTPPRGYEEGPTPGAPQDPTPDQFGPATDQREPPAHGDDDIPF